MDSAIEKVTITRGELAELVQLTPRRIGQLIQEGLPCLDDGRQIPLAQAIRWLLQRRTQRTSRQDLDESRRKKLDADRQLVELKQRILGGEFVAVDYAAEIMSGICVNSRNALMALPSKLAPAMMQELEYREAFDLLESEIHRSLSELSKQVVHRRLEKVANKPEALNRLETLEQEATTEAS